MTNKVLNYTGKITLAIALIAVPTSITLADVGYGGGGGEAGVIYYSSGGGSSSPVITTTSTSTTSGGSSAATTTPTTTTSTSTPSTGEVLGASAYNFTSSLSVGSSGADVSALQQFLTSEGFYTGPITGYFGPLTEAAVKAFQSKNNIDPTGNVGPLTIAVLNQGVISTTPETSGSVLGASTYNFTSSFGVGSNGADVSALQQFLITEGYLTAISSPTGYFGPLTEAAVKAFQAKNNIDATGYVGPLTIAVLNQGVVPASE